ncbi:MAG: hypothetical protein V1646_04175 [bacterium]
MNILSQSSFIASFVLVTSIFNSIDAAKGISIQLSPRTVTSIKQASFSVNTKEGETKLNVLTTLLDIYRSHPELLELVLNFYNSIKSGEVKDTIIPAALLNQMPPELISIVCITDGSESKLNPTIYDALDLLAESIKDGIDAAKAKTCKACCQNFWCKTTPKFLLMTVELVAPFLLTLASSATSKAPVTENLTVAIPTAAIRFGTIR